MILRTTHLARCIETLDRSLVHLRQTSPESIEYEVFRNAVIKSFELTLETAGKLLRKALRSYATNPRSVDDLGFKDVLRHAARHGLLGLEEVERWFAYRENRNTTAHDYGEAFAEETLSILPRFVDDARRLEAMLRERAAHADP